MYCVVNTVLCSQNIKNGMYSNGTETICINDDTLIMFDSNNIVHFYKGKYQFIDNRIFLENNQFLGKNASIEIEPCSPDSIEIRVLSIYITNAIMGKKCKKSIFTQDESPYYHIVLNNECLYSSKNTGIQIGKHQFNEDVLSGGFILSDDARLSGFIDYFDFPLEYGTRYIIKQQYYHFRPYMIYNKSGLALTYIDGNIIETFYDKSIEVFKYCGPLICDSCFNELKNRFPLLFE